MSDDFDDDSFDAALASIDIPAALPPKIPKTTAPTRPQPTPSTSASTQSQSQPQSQPVPGPSKPLSAPNPHCILVNPKQRNNPLLKFITNVPMEIRDIIPDYIVGRTSCVLYISLKYHTLNPDYIVNRLKELGKQYELRVLLAQVDNQDPHGALKSLTRISMLADLTLMLAWNAEEAGRIIENYKMMEKTPPDMIMERLGENTHQQIITALTSIKPVNKTDAVTLLQHFGTLENIINASEESLISIAGLGPRKAKKLYKTFNAPFSNS